MSSRGANGLERPEGIGRIDKRMEKQIGVTQRADAVCFGMRTNAGALFPRNLV